MLVGVRDDMRFQVEVNDPPIEGNKPITVWWSNHEWSDLTHEEARELYEALQDALGERGTFRLTPAQSEAIRHMGEEE